MASIPVSLDDNLEKPLEGDGSTQCIRVIVADTQAIFRAGLRKIFALEDDIRVVGQAETLSANGRPSRNFRADILIFEAALTPNPVDAVQRTSASKAHRASWSSFRRARRRTHARTVSPRRARIVSREVEPELLVDCLRKVAAGEAWLDQQGMNWVLEAFRTQSTRPAGARPKVQLTPKGNLDRVLRDAGHEEQGNRVARGHH